MCLGRFKHAGARVAQDYENNTPRGLVRLDFFLPLPREGSDQKECQRKIAAW
jgi:hypothetical protein